VLVVCVYRSYDFIIRSSCIATEPLTLSGMLYLFLYKAEDPATGIAAAALAIAMRRRGYVYPTYKIYQGTAMQKPSVIVVEDIEEKEDNLVSFRLLGRVEVHERTERELLDHEI
jgi:hypothetical protein